ncbi:MAG: DegT/DnrJ/EryC1/StrS family aminotransferase, partial [Thermodesulforhabdaceae bacterium]
MITDLLVAPDVILEICASDEDPALPTLQALAKAKKENVRTWIYVGSIDRIHSELSTYLKDHHGFSAEKARKEASQRLLLFSKEHRWLSALSEDGEAIASPTPLLSQLCKALDRLGDGAFVLTRGKDFPTSRVITPEAYLNVSSAGRNAVPFVDLASQQDLIRHDLEKRMFAVLMHGRYVGGPEIEELEERLQHELRVKHAITCSSGTDALLMALLALGIGPGDAVFTVPFTFVATAEVIRLVGATPVFVDIDPVSLTMDPAALKKTLDALQGNTDGVPLPEKARMLKPKAIITVDLFGCPAHYNEINSIARNHGLFVIEDAAQAFGAAYQGKPAGSLGDIGCTSFFPAKTLGAYGDGGAIFTNSDILAEKLRLIRN